MLCGSLMSVTELMSTFFQNSPAAENMYTHQLNNFASWMRDQLRCHPSDAPNYLAMALALPETIKSPVFADLLEILTNDMDTEKALRAQLTLIEFLFSGLPKSNDLEVFSRTVFTLLNGYNSIPNESLRLQEQWYAVVSYKIATCIVSRCVESFLQTL